ncbi:hypothetical protein KCP71_07150 [Salmonella enterica subsp. enterica]|nr:hypothetical protein KCP71_07150 [Salmonella enterica subsp. enterica]
MSVWTNGEPRRKHLVPLFHLLMEFLNAVSHDDLHRGMRLPRCGLFHRASPFGDVAGTLR